MTYEKKIARTYYAEMAGSLAVYCVLIVLALRIGKPMPDGAARTLLLVSPMAGFVLMLWAIIRQLARMDEYLRIRLLENIAVGAAITAGLTFTYGFLETAGYPQLSMFTVWCLLAGATGMTQLARKVLGR